MKASITEQEFVALCVLSGEGQSVSDIKNSMTNSGTPTRYRHAGAYDALQRLVTKGFVQRSGDVQVRYSITAGGVAARNSYLYKMKLFCQRAEEMIGE